MEQQDNLSYQIQQKNNEIARLKERIAELEKKIREQQELINYSPRTEYINDIKSEQLDNKKRAETDARNVRLENEIRDLKRQQRIKYD